MAKQLLALGTSANDGTGDSLRAGGDKINDNFTEVYDALGGSSGAQNLLVNTASPSAGDALTWNGTAFAAGQPTNKNILEQNLNVNGYNIVSSGNGNIVIQSDGTGDIALRNGTNATDTIIDGADGFLKWNAPYVSAVNLPPYGTYTGMFAYLNDTKKAYFSSDAAWRELLDTTNSRVQDLGNVQDTTYADGEVPTWNAANGEFRPGTGGGAGGGNIFATFNADTGSTTALGATDTLTVTGGTDITTSITGDTLTINYAGSGGFSYSGSGVTEGDMLLFDGFDWVPVSAPTITWLLGNDGTNSHFTFTGSGFPNTTNDPILYLTRGQIYRFKNDSQYTIHPFEIRQSAGGNAYTAGVANDGAGTTTFTVPMDAPATLYYQCANHPSMGNQIVVVT